MFLVKAGSRRPSCGKRHIKTCLFAAIFVAATSSHAVAQAQSKQILMLHSFGREFFPWSEYAKAIRREIGHQSPRPVDITDYAIVTARSTNEDPEVAFTTYLQSFYHTRPPDLIVAIGAPASGFVQRQRERLFPAVPVLFTAVDQRFVEERSLTANETSVAVKIDLPPLFQNILQVLPQTKKVVVISGNSPSEQVWLGEMRNNLKSLEDEFQIEYWNDRPFEDMLKDAATLPANTAIFWPQLRVDAAGIVYEGIQPLERLYAVTDAPIFSYDDVFFTGQTVGGPMLSMANISRQAANVVTRILAGEHPADIKTAPIGYATPRYDWRQLQRWGISEHLLPPGAEIYFREPSLWETYRWVIALVTAVIILQAGLISRLLYEQRRRRYAEVQSRQRMSELARVNRISTAGELTASIAHEINQPLGAIQTNIETAELILKSSSPDVDELKEIVADIRHDQNRASEVIRRLRSLVRKTPFEVRDIDLNDIVRETEELVSALSAIGVARQVDLRNSITPLPLPIRGDRIQLQQVILNLIMNAVDAMSDIPSAERKVTIRTARDEDLAEISILDAGPGIPRDKIKEVFEPFFTTKAEGMGIGLSIARTIIEAHDGRIWVENHVGGGADFRIQLPLSQPLSGSSAALWDNSAIRHPLIAPDDLGPIEKY